MRKITDITTDAFLNFKNKKVGNTEVCTGISVAGYYLHNNLIASYNPEEKTLFITDAGRRSNTTKERLNGILRKFKLGGIYQKDGYRYYSDNESDRLRTGKITFNL